MIFPDSEKDNPVFDVPLMHVDCSGILVAYKLVLLEANYVFTGMDVSCPN